MILDKIYVSNTEPSATNILWAKPIDGGAFALYAFISGKWGVLKLMNDNGTPYPDDDTPGGSADDCYTKEEIDSKLADILGLDAEGVAELKALIEDDDALTGLLSEIARKANTADLDVYCRKDADNTHSDSVSDTYVKRGYYEDGGLLQVDRLTVGGDSIEFHHSHRTQETKDLSLQIDDVEKLKDLPTATELTQELGGKQDTINDLAAIRSGASAGSTAVQPSDLTPIDNRLDNVEYCLGDYLKAIYVFNWENHTTTTTEPIYTTIKLSTERYGSTFNCKLSAGSATISALYLGSLDSTDRRMYFTQAGTVTMYLVLLKNTSIWDRMIAIYNGSGNVRRYIYPGEIPYNSEHICTPITFEVEAGCYLQMGTTNPSLNTLIWLGQIDFEIAGSTEVKQISKDVHANSNAIKAIEHKIGDIETLLATI